MSRTDSMDFLKKIICSEDSIYKYLTSEDEEKLKAALPREYQINPELEANVMSGLFNYMEGVREDIDYLVVANLIKIMAIALFNKDSLHKDALDRTFDHIYTLLFSCIFKESA